MHCWYLYAPHTFLPVVNWEIDEDRLRSNLTVQVVQVTSCFEWLYLSLIRYLMKKREVGCVMNGVVHNLVWFLTLKKQTLSPSSLCDTWTLFQIRKPLFTLSHIHKPRPGPSPIPILNFHLISHTLFCLLSIFLFFSLLFLFAFPINILLSIILPPSILYLIA